MKFEIGEIIKHNDMYWEVVKRGKKFCVCMFGDRQKMILHKNIEKVNDVEVKIFKLEQAIYSNKRHIANNSWQETRKERKRINKLLERKINELKEELKCL